MPVTEAADGTQQKPDHSNKHDLSEADAFNVLEGQRKTIAKEIHSQMMAHFFEDTTEFEVQVSCGFTELKSCNYTATVGQAPRHFRETVEDVGRIKQMLFGGFTKCLYSLQKFDSDTERRFAVSLPGNYSEFPNSSIRSQLLVLVQHPLPHRTPTIHHA